MSNSSPPAYEIIIATSSKMTDEVYDCCVRVLNKGSIPVILTNVTPLHCDYPEVLQKIMKLSDDVMVFEAAKVATRKTLRVRMDLFITSNIPPNVLCTVHYY